MKTSRLSCLSGPVETELDGLLYFLTLRKKAIVTKDKTKFFSTKHSHIKICYYNTMLSTKYRFHSRGGVNYTYKHGHTIRAPLISLIHTPNTRRKTRFAVVVSKKVMKSAVGRNRIRRRIYEAIRLELPQLKCPTDYILLVHNREIGVVPFVELQKTIKDLLLKSKNI